MWCCNVIFFRCKQINKQINKNIVISVSFSVQQMSSFAMRKKVAILIGRWWFSCSFHSKQCILSLKGECNARTRIDSNARLLTFLWADIRRANASGPVEHKGTDNGQVRVNFWLDAKSWPSQRRYARHFLYHLLSAFLSTLTISHPR